MICSNPETGCCKRLALWPCVCLCVSPAGLKQSGFKSSESVHTLCCFPHCPGLQSDKCCMLQRGCVYPLVWYKTASLPTHMHVPHTDSVYRHTRSHPPTTKQPCIWAAARLTCNHGSFSDSHLLLGSSCRPVCSTTESFTCGRRDAMREGIHPTLTFLVLTLVTATTTYFSLYDEKQAEKSSKNQCNKPDRTIWCSEGSYTHMLTGAHGSSVFDGCLHVIFKTQ